MTQTNASYSKSVEAPHEKSKYLLIFSTGFAMFSMFFGSGNLVFPLAIGIKTLNQWEWSSLGLLITGVLVPFLGLLSLMLFEGNYRRFFDRMGKGTSFLLPLLMLLLMGPFGVIPRCITVAHGSFLLLFPNCSLLIFSIIFSALIFLMTFRKSKIVPILGLVLTPLLLISLAVISFFGFLESSPLLKSPLSASASYMSGLVEGYQTMDLVASFFFAIVVIDHIRSKLKQRNEDQKISSRQFSRLTLASMVIGAALLALIYLSFVFLGAAYAPHLQGTPTEWALGRIALLTLGPHAGIVVATAVVLACLTTAIVLSSVFSDFAYERVTLKKIPVNVWLSVTLIISVLISTLEFSGIAAFLGPILKWLYPGMIVLTICNILHRLYGMKIVKTPVYVTLGITLGYMLFA